MINVRCLSLPLKIKAFSSKNEDGSYTIVLNDKLNYEQNIESFIHELSHIVREDHEKCSVEEIEIAVRKRCLVNERN